MKEFSRDFNLLLFARVISVIGDTAALIALFFKVKHLGPWAVAVLVAGTSVAMMVTSTWVGKLIDRHSMKKILILTSFIQGLVCVGLVFSNTTFILILNLLLGVGQAVVVSATGAWAPTLVPQEKIAKAFGTLQIGFSIAGLVGYGLGGLFVGRFGVNSALVLNAISFFLLIPFLMAISKDRVGQPELDAKGKMKGGFKIVWHNPALRSVVITMTAYVMTLMIFNPLEVFLTTEVLGATPSQYGLINMVWAGSLGVGAVLITKIMKNEWGHAKPAIIICVLGGASMVGIGLSPNLIVLAVILAIAGLIFAGFNIFISPLIVFNSIESERGRVNATMGAMTSAGSATGMALGGLLGNFMPVRTVIVAAGVLAATSIIFTAKGMLAADHKIDKTEERASD